jgi:serine/threonine protein kinase
MSENVYPIINNYLLFQEAGTDCIGVDYRAGVIDQDQRKAVNHCLVTEVYPFLATNPNMWKRINILLEGVKKSNIPKLYSPDKIIQEGDRKFLAYPIIASRTFEEVLDDSHKKDNPINFDLAFSIAFAIADLIDVGSSIVVSGEKSFHGFLTPDNIIIDYDGKIYLKNYGIYPYLSRDEKVFNEMVKKYGAWIAPEFLRKEKLVCQTDIYHLGYIIYRILTGKYFSCSPEEDFDSKFSNISFSQHIPSADKEFLTNIITFFKRTLHPMPNQRFSNIKEFKDYISNKFNIEELSSVTFNLAYFMNSLYMEAMEEEKKVLAQELEYVIPEEPKEEPAAEPGKSDDGLVKDILTGLDEHERKSSKSKLLIPLVAVIIIAIAVSIFMYLNQQEQTKQLEAQQQQQKRQDADIQKKLDEYQEKLKSIEDKAATTAEEKKQQEDELKKLQEWRDGELQKAKDLQKQQRIKKQQIENSRIAEEARIAKEAEDTKIKEAAQLEEQKKIDAAKKLKEQEDARKKLEEERNRIKPGQLIALTEATTKPKKIKGKDPVFTYAMRKKYKGNKYTARAILLIDEYGFVASIRMITKMPDDLKESILKAVQRWQYEPAKKEKTKVKVWLPVAIGITM